MRSFSKVFVLFFFACGIPAVAQAKGPALGGSVDSTQILVGDTDAHVGIWVDTPKDIIIVDARPPMVVSLVVDTSGSMSGEKIRNARMAASSVIENLTDGDIVALYGFSDGVRELVPPSTVNAGSRSSLLRYVRGLEAGGSTNLYGGLQAGISQMSDAPSSHTVRRVIVISDGQANVGLSDPVSLGNLAARGTEYGAQVTAIGVGLDYDEQTLGTLAMRSAGRFYHLAHPHQMAGILEQELQLLAQTVATDAYIEIIPGPGVIIIDGHSGTRPVRLPLGNLYAGQHREALVRVRLDASAPGRHTLGTAKLVYTPNGSKSPVVKTHKLSYGVTADKRKAAKSKNGQVIAMVQARDAAKAQMQATARLNAGDAAGAKVYLEEAERKLESAAQAAPAAAKRRYKKSVNKVRDTKKKASSARSRDDMRGAALESNDAALELQGY